jgi:hypothetical protein
VRTEQTWRNRQTFEKQSGEKSETPRNLFGSLLQSIFMHKLVKSWLCIRITCISLINMKYHCRTSELLCQTFIQWESSIFTFILKILHVILILPLIWEVFAVSSFTHFVGFPATFSLRYSFFPYLDPSKDLS